MDATERRRLDALMAALADGDRRAFDPVFSLSMPLARRFASRAMNGSPDHEDVAQLALEKVFARASEYDPRRPALPWILGVVANEVRSARRRAARRREDAWVERAHDAASPEALAIDRELACAAESMLEQMSAEDRDAVLASIGAIDRPALPPATFRKRVQRALARLRGAWKEVHDG